MSARQQIPWGNLRYRSEKYSQKTVAYANLIYETGNDFPVFGNAETGTEDIYRVIKQPVAQYLQLEENLVD